MSQLPANLPPQARTLVTEASNFATSVSQLVRATVAPSVTFGVRLNARFDTADIGVGIAGRDVRGHPFAVPIRGGRGEIYVLAHFKVQLDSRERRFLSGYESTVGVFAAPDEREPLVRYEYERHKQRYAKAHLHVHGESRAMGRIFALAGIDKPALLEKFHWPVGGKRFRPTLEDVVEALIVAELVEPVVGWPAAIEDSREAFYQRQLRAAVRDEQDIAVDELRRLGWRVTAPPNG